MAAFCVSTPLRIVQPSLKATASESCCQVQQLSSQRCSQKSEGTKVYEIITPLHHCAFGENTEVCWLNRLSPCQREACPGSRFLQNQLVTSCVLDLADGTVCCCINWILQITAVLFCHEQNKPEVVSGTEPKIVCKVSGPWTMHALSCPA